MSVKNFKLKIWPKLAQTLEIHYSHPLANVTPKLKNTMEILDHKFLP